MKFFNFFKLRKKSIDYIETMYLPTLENDLPREVEKPVYNSENELVKILEFIKNNSTLLGIHLTEGASDIDISFFEKRKFILPEDFKLLYKFSNGFETNEDMFRLVPLEEIISRSDRNSFPGNRDKYLISKTSFHFSEYMIYCDMWTVDVNVKQINDYRIYNKAEDVVFLTKSLAEFLIVFINKGLYDGLYEWRENVKRQYLLRNQ